MTAAMPVRSLFQIIPKRLRLKVNDSISIYFIRPNRSLRGRKIKVVGIYKTGIDDYDKQISIGDLKLLEAE
jgi:lipoprotein-releasing system permease protein